MSLLLVLLATLTCVGAEVPRPMPGTFVHDFAGVIPDDKRAEIQAKAQRLKDEYKTEIAVVTVDSLQGEESFDYSMRMARSWGIGSKDNEIRGLLILVAVKDRKTAFRTSRHVEGELPDGVTGEISRRMNAHFKTGDFGRGLSLGMDMLLDRLKAVYEPQPVAARFTTPEVSPGRRWLPVTSAFIGIALLGLIYLVLRRLKGKIREADAARRKASGGSFRAWATAQDPSPVPKKKRKSQDITRAGSRGARGKKRGSERSADNTPSYGYETSSYVPPSSYDSSPSSYDSGSSSSSDSGSSYSGGSDFGGGGSDSGW
jgi:uncharacterized membrane protein YgcG